MDQRGGDLVSEKVRDTDAPHTENTGDTKLLQLSNKIIGKKAPGFSE